MSAGAISQSGRGAGPVVSLRDLSFSWDGTKPILEIPSLELARGETLFVRGSSGSGKSTLLGLIGGVLLADRGELAVLGTSLSSLNARARDRFRSDHLGIIFQMFNLLPYLSVIENVSLACRFSAKRTKAAIAGGGVEVEAARLLEGLGLDRSLMRRSVTALSVGQQQRVAVARALIGSPEIIIADEPTSALDEAHKAKFIDLLMSECAARGAALIFVSHENSLSDRFDRVVDLAELNQASQLEPA
ncbi:MAG: ATP-binding cassette domain-containing protein [Parvibaculum sp.]